MSQQNQVFHQQVAEEPQHTHEVKDQEANHNLESQQVLQPDLQKSASKNSSGGGK
jgi:hypothetical protein